MHPFAADEAGDQQRAEGDQLAQRGGPIRDEPEQFLHACLPEKPAGALLFLVGPAGLLFDRPAGTRFRRRMATQAFSAARTSSSIFFASPNNMRLLSL